MGWLVHWISRFTCNAREIVSTSINLKKTLMLISMQKINFPDSLFPWDIAKILHTYYFEYFVHDWPCPPKLTALTCKETCLSACKKSTTSFQTFLRYYNLKNADIWLAQIIFVNTDKMEHTTDKIFQLMWKVPFLAHFLHFLGKIEFSSKLCSYQFF